MRAWMEPKVMTGLITIVMSVLGAATVRGGFVYEVDLTGFETFGDFTSPSNSWVELDLFPNARIVGAEWIDLEFTSENGSYRSEFVISLNDSSQSGLRGTFWDMQPAASVDEPGTYSGSGTFSVPAAFGSGPFNLLSDGVLRVNVYETFVDTGPDGEEIRNAFVSGGTLRITAVPEPSSLIYIASSLGVWYAARRRRQLKLA